MVIFHCQGFYARKMKKVKRRVAIGGIGGGSGSETDGFCGAILRLRLFFYRL